MFVVILLGIYKFLWDGCKWSIRPLAQANLFGWPRTFSTKSSPRIGGSTDPSALRSPVSLADSDEDRRLRDGVGAEVVQLHPIVLAQRPHEPTHRNTEPPLVEPHEAHDVARGGIRLCLLRPRGDPRRRPLVGFSGSSLSSTSRPKTASVAVDLPHGNGSSISAIASDQGGTRGREFYCG